MTTTYPSGVKNQVFRTETENLRWRIPSFLNNDQAMLMLLHILSDTVDDNHIDSVYGSFLSPWNAGRPSLLRFDEDSFIEIINLYNEYNVAVQVAFNNYNVTDDDLYDSDSNKALELLNELSNENGIFNSVIVASDTLASHIRRNYPAMYITSSVIKPIYEDGRFTSYYNKLIGGGLYDEVTPRPEYFFDEYYLDDEKDMIDRDNVVVLCNQTCFRHCPTAKVHYDNYEKRERGLEYDMSFINNCVMRKSDYGNIDDRCLMSLSMMENLGSEGFTKFKLQGRNKSAVAFLDILGSYVFEPIGWYQGVKDAISAASAIDRLDRSGMNGM